MIIETYNQWTDDSTDFCLLVFMLHRCDLDWGFDVFLFGFGFMVRFK